MNAKKAVYRFDDQPIVWVRLENPHDASILPFDMRALVDTGAQVSAVPAYLCQTLGHSFEDGISESSASGVGAEAMRTFMHSTKLTVLFPEESNTESRQTFEPIEFPCVFIDQPLPFVLLGQRDFLRMFLYVQDGHDGWFSLEQKTIS
jgi:hypothetical protein